MDQLRTMPQSKPAEAALLGCMMLDSELIAEIQGQISEDSFFTHAHRYIYQAIVSLYAAEGECDGLVIRHYLDTHGQLEQVGGVEYLKAVLDSTPSSKSWRKYLKVVADMASRRAAIEAATNAIESAYDMSADPSTAVAKAHESLFEAIEVLKPADTVEDIGSLVQQAFEPLLDGKKMDHGLNTGFHEIDDLLCGLQPGDLIYLAARPSIGKTALMLAMLDTITIRDKVPALLFSLEMGNRALAERILCSHADVSLTRTHKGCLEAQERRRLAASISDYDGAGLAICDRTPQTVYDIAALARQHKQQRDIQLVCVDYLQLMYMPGRTESRQLEIAAISRELKGLARSLNIPVVALSQLNRQIENRTEHRPRLADLRESGSLEQDADVVLLLHREDAYHLEEGPAVYNAEGKQVSGYEPTNIGEIIVAKHRNGPTGRVDVVWRPEMVKFANMSTGKEL